MALAAELRRDTARIAVICGDGVGQEVIPEALKVLSWCAKQRSIGLDLWQLDLGADRYLRDGVTLPKEIREEIAQTCAAVFLGALGDARVPGFEHAKDILLGMRVGFDLYANVRPIKPLHDRLVPLKGVAAEAIDIVVYRENTEGAYAGVGGQLRRGTADEIAINEDINTRRGVERILRAAFEFTLNNGRKRVHMADKSNALRYAHELWLRVFNEVRREYPSVESQHIYIDTLCLKLVQAPSEFDVIVTNNMFGDIVTDLAAALQGGLGMAASANVHPALSGSIGLFEPVHGSAPDLVGTGRANPFAAILTAGLLLEHLGWADERARIERAVAEAVKLGLCTPDVGGSLGTGQACQAVLERLADC
jgi:3-isopropylmalate dehydrogenase